MSSEPDNTEKSAPAPFVPDKPFDDANADLILTSSDGIDFRVRRSVLTLLSPVFEDMLRLPQPPGGDTIPSVTMSESAIVLDRVLRFCYPGAERDGTPETADQLSEILQTTITKYDMQSIVPKGKRYLQAYLLSDPVAVFAIACCHEWRDLASAAARRSLEFPIRSFATISPVAELRHISAAHYHTLLRYHAMCGAACARLKATEELQWVIDAGLSHSWFTCSSCPREPDSEIWVGNTRLPVNIWFLAYMKAAGKALEVKPLAAVEDSQLMIQAVAGLGCSSCRSQGFQKLQDFAKNLFSARIRSLVDQVKLELSF
ncbi:BTB domain-containing protein [Favolaschia claudopus]|uniref:BTB domain-containing protein n=1 Tax=Favolaschia claudopus TaxID=2862362 RepID=A0AAW0CBY3_9AGAR